MWKLCVNSCSNYKLMTGVLLVFKRSSHFQGHSYDTKSILKHHYRLVNYITWGQSILFQLLIHLFIEYCCRCYIKATCHFNAICLIWTHALKASHHAQELIIAMHAVWWLIALGFRNTSNLHKNTQCKQSSTVTQQQMFTALVSSALTNKLIVI